jgi:hypothetical protein
MPTVGGQQDLPCGGHRGLPAVGPVLTLRNRPGRSNGDATFIGFEVASPAGFEVEVGHDPG